MGLGEQGVFCRPGRDVSRKSRHNPPAVAKGNSGLLSWLNGEIEKLGKENFFHADYEATLRPVYGKDSDADSLVVEGGKL